MEICHLLSGDAAVKHVTIHLKMKNTGKKNVPSMSSCPPMLRMQMETEKYKNSWSLQNKNSFIWDYATESMLKCI